MKRFILFVLFCGSVFAQTEMILDDLGNGNFYKNDSLYYVFIDTSALPLPPLVDVPVKFIKFGGFTICAEPKAGDEGLAHFSDRCIDGWWESSQNSVPLDIRFHDLSDAFFESGYSSKNNAIKIIPNALHMGADSAFIRMFEDGTIEVKGNMTIDGSVTATGVIESNVDVTAQGKSLVSHTHGGVQSGSSSTLPPN